MRTKLTNIRLLASLVAPLLFACGSETGAGGELVTVPQCDDANKVLSTDQDGRLICKDLPAGAAALPNCKKYSEALTSDGSRPSCTNRNNESQASTDALNKLESSEKLLNEYTTRLGKLTPGPGARAVFCGVTTETTQGQINEGNARGSAAAAAKCAKLPACGATAKMCSVYDMYYSVASGALKSDQTISPAAWVFMASWANTSGSTEPTAGLADNCASYTYGSAHKIWGGTAIEWSGRLDTNDKVLKFFSGLSGAGCGTARQIACCK